MGRRGFDGCAIEFRKLDRFLSQSSSAESMHLAICFLCQSTALFLDLLTSIYQNMLKVRWNKNSKVYFPTKLSALLEFVPPRGLAFLSSVSACFKNECIDLLHCYPWDFKFGKGRCSLLSST
jgi:hypothetical protein